MKEVPLLKKRKVKSFTNYLLFNSFLLIFTFSFVVSCKGFSHTTSTEYSPAISQV